MTVNELLEFIEKEGFTGDDKLMISMGGVFTDDVAVVSTGYMGEKHINLIDANEP